MRALGKWFYIVSIGLFSLRLLFSLHILRGFTGDLSQLFLLLVTVIYFLISIFILLKPCYGFKDKVLPLTALAALLMIGGISASDYELDTAATTIDVVLSFFAIVYSAFAVSGHYLAQDKAPIGELPQPWKNACKAFLVAIYVSVFCIIIKNSMTGMIIGAIPLLPGALISSMLGVCPRPSSICFDYCSMPTCDIAIVLITNVIFYTFVGFLIGMLRARKK